MSCSFCVLRASAKALPHCADSLRSSRPLASAAFRSSAAQVQRHQVMAAAAARQPQQQASEALALATTLTAMGITLPARAEEGAEAAVAAFGGADALTAAQAATEIDPSELIFTALFTIAIAALTVVTLGVAYLSFTSWNDNRLEQEDRRRAESFRPNSNGAAASKKAAAKKAPAAAKEPEEFKGFGKK